MSKTVKDILKEATQGMLTEESLDEIQGAFDQAVDEKVTLHVEKALMEQDEDYSNKLTELLETIDTDHSAKLEKVVQAIDKNHAQKLATVVKHYTTQLTEAADDFSSEVVSKVSDYLDLYLEENVPAQEIAEAVKNKKAQGLLEQLRHTLGVDFALSQDTIKEAIIDGKNQISEATATNEQVAKENKELKESLQTVQAELILERKTAELPEAKKNYIVKVLGDKSPEFITENFEYTLKMFDKSEEERLEELQEEAKVDAESAQVDRPTAQEVVQESTEEKEFSGHPILNEYMNELTKS